jgi:hypothetical protein
MESLIQKRVAKQRLKGGLIQDWKRRNLCGRSFTAPLIACGAYKFRPASGPFSVLSLQQINQMMQERFDHLA